MNDWLNKLIKKDDIFVDPVLLLGVCDTNHPKFKTINVNNRATFKKNIRIPIAFLNRKLNQCEFCLVLMEQARGIPRQSNHPVKGERHQQKVWSFFKADCPPTNKATTRFDILD